MRGEREFLLADDRICSLLKSDVLCVGTNYMKSTIYYSHFNYIDTITNIKI